MAEWTASDGERRRTGGRCNMNENARGARLRPFGGWIRTMAVEGMPAESWWVVRNGSGCVERGTGESPFLGISEPNGERTSDDVLVVGCPEERAWLLVGAVTCRRSPTYLTAVYRSRSLREIRIVQPDLLPGDEPEEVVALRGDDWRELLRRYGETCAERMGARPASRRPPAGWCSWYCHRDRVSERDVLAAADALAARRNDFPAQVVQIDSGYQLRDGDWTGPLAAAWPSPLAETAAAIRARGFEPGLWTAPFHATPESDVFRSHPDWFVRSRDGQPLLVRGFTSPLWATLDASRPEARAHLADTFRSLRGMGFTYFKLDALGFALPDGVLADPAATPVSAFRAGLAAIREAVPDAWLLGCGAHHLASLGLVDANRMGCDTAADSVPKIEHAALQTLAKFWTFGRWFAPDPDVIVLRDGVPDGAARISALAAIMTGQAISGDRVETLPPERLSLLSRAASLRVSGIRPDVGVEPSHWPRLFTGTLADGRPAAAVINARDEPFTVDLDALEGFAPGAPVKELLRPLGPLADCSLSIPPHDAALLVPPESASSFDRRE